MNETRLGYGGTPRPETDNTVTCVGCEVKNCKFNDLHGSYCTANQISVQNRNALNKGETYCNTFTPRGSY